MQQRRHPSGEVMFGEDESAGARVTDRAERRGHRGDEGIEVVAAVARVGPGAVEASTGSAAPPRIGEVESLGLDRGAVEAEKSLEVFGPGSVKTGVDEDLGRFGAHDEIVVKDETLVAGEYGRGMSAFG